MTEMKFFIYGSMSEGLVHFQKIEDFITGSVPAKIRGSVYRLKVGYPVVLETGADLVPGQLMGLKASELLINLLDEFHAFDRQNESRSLFFRREIEVFLDDGTKVLAWTYLLNPEKLPQNASLIEGGDWKTNLAQNAPLTEKLTDRQRAYIQRLGNSTSREVIPIDLSLYRELMNLEIIVDKGRRLALSKIGHEVFRYLK